MTVDEVETKTRQAEEGGPDAMTPLLEARTIRKSFTAGLDVLNGVSLTINEGDRLCILGPSGSGKTTFLRCLNLLEIPTGGQLLYRDTLVGEWPAARGAKLDLRSHRRRCGFVFQHFELFPHLTALQNIALGPVRVLNQPRAQVEERALAMLDRVGLRHLASARPRSLSGGQQQRVAIARAMAMDPDLLLLDEPTSALDAEMVDEVLDIIAGLASDGMTMVIVTHELRFAREVSDRILVMDRGGVCEEGLTEQMFEQPAKQRTHEILGGGRRRW